MSGNLPYVAARLFGVPLLIDQQYAHVIVSALSERLGVQPIVGSDALNSYHRPNRRLSVGRESGIAILPIVGGLVHRGDGPEAPSGLQSYTSLQNTLRELIEDDAVRGVLLDIDSSGGEAGGLHELTRYMRAARREKPVWAIANTAALSAAYWLGATADRLYAAPGARIGSIGVYVAHTDMSGAQRKRGVVTSFVFAGKHKLDGNPFEPLPADVRETMQQHVNEVYDEFVSHVADVRGMAKEAVRDTEAAVLGPAQAKELGLVDDVAGLGEVLSAMSAYLHNPYHR